MEASWIQLACPSGPSPAFSEEAPLRLHVSQAPPDLSSPERATGQSLPVLSRQEGAPLPPPRPRAHRPAHLDHAVKRLLVLGPEYLPNVQHVQLTAGDHDADQRVVPSPQALEDKWVLGTELRGGQSADGPSLVENTLFLTKRYDQEQRKQNLAIPALCVPPALISIIPTLVSLPNSVALSNLLFRFAHLGSL